MKTLVRIAKWIGALLAAGVLFLMIVITFGTVESRLECSGQIQHHFERNARVIAVTPATLYAKVETYRWFLFWTDHGAMITWDIQPTRNTGFGYYTHNDFGMPITDFTRTTNYGSLLPISNHIRIDTARDGGAVFDGMCSSRA